MWVAAKIHNENNILKFSTDNIVIYIEEWINETRTREMLRMRRLGGERRGFLISSVADFSIGFHLFGGIIGYGIADVKSAPLQPAKRFINSRRARCSGVVISLQFYPLVICRLVIAFMCIVSKTPLRGLRDSIPLILT